MASRDALPNYLKVRLQKAGNGGADKSETDDVEDLALDENVSADDVDELDSESVADDVEADDAADTSPDDNAWKGRLKKAQEENERLKLQVQNGSFAAAKLLELQEREKQKDAELAALREQLQAREPSKETANNGVFSDDERDTLEMEMGGDVVRLLESKLQGLQGKHAGDDVAALRAEMRERDEQSRRVAWFDAMKTQIPEIQGLLQSNADFMQFLQDKRDFSGNSAFDMVQAAGANLDVEKIPLIRQLIDEFKGLGAAKEKRKATARPLSGAGQTHEVGRKRKAGDKERALRMRLKNTGQREQLEKLIEQFDWS